MRSKITLGVLVALLVLIVGWLTAPIWHWLVFDLIGLNIVFWIAVVLACLFGLLAATDKTLAKAIEGILAILLGLFACGYLLFAGVVADRILVQSIKPTPMSELPDTGNVRYLTFEIATRYAQSKMNDPYYQIGDLDPLDMQDLYFTAPRIPNGFINSWSRQTYGVLIVKPDGSVDPIDQNLTYGEGMIFTDNIYWQLFTKKYWVEIPEIYYVVNKGELLTMVPYTNYRFEFPVFIPQWGGIFVVHPDGFIEDLPSDQAVNDPRFVGQRLFPEAIAKRIGDSWQYRNGILNAMFVHKDQTEVPTIADSKNQMPYLIPANPNPYWFTALEPSGPSLSIYKMLFVDAHTGIVGLHETPSNRNLLGPNAAVGYVKGAFTSIQWYSAAEKGGSGTFIAVEPKPVLHKNELFWQVTVTNLSYSGVSRTVFINAETQDVKWFQSLAEVKAFLDDKFDGRSPEGQAISQPIVPGTAQPGAAVPTDLSKYTTPQLLQLMQQILTEMEKRGVK
jgi:hypothetical protein